MPSRQPLLRKTHVTTERPPFERIALVLQGGGALGAYQGGVYQALAEANLHPDWVAGISIGAINSALIAGNKRRVNSSDRNARDPVRMQIGLRQGLINAALIGAKGTAALQHQCDPLERRALSRDMGLAQQRLTARHYG